MGYVVLRLVKGGAPALVAMPSNNITPSGPVLGSC